MLTARDAQRMAGVHPVLVSAIEAIFQTMHDSGTPMFVVNGVRTNEEQAALYTQGRTTCGPNPTLTRPLGSIVTNCDGVTEKSDHQPEADGYGHAVDCAFLPTKERPNAWDPAWPWTAFGDALEQHGMEWGGRFKSPADLDHAQYVAKVV